MPPSLALALTTLFITGLFLRDQRLSKGVSHAIWIPLIWMTLIGSRFPSEWLAGPASASMEGYMEGNSIDRNIFLGLIVLGVIVLSRRKISWSVFFKSNVFIVLFFSYTLLSLIWSEFPIVAFKRWHKVLGHVVMALVVLTEEDPAGAFEALLRRGTYILIPVSVMLIKYFPAMSRAFDVWTGEAVNIGISTNKNLLGNVCFIAGLFVLTVILMRRRREGSGKLDWGIDLLMAGLTLWLMNMAHSATSLVCLALGGAAVIGMQLRPIAKYSTAIILSIALTSGFLEMTLNLREQVIVGLGRDTTLTGRTELWETLWQIPVNPIVGVGFESFWLGNRAETLWAKYWWKPNQAHNGYFETYLNLGYVGVGLQIGMLLAAYLTAKKRMLAAMKTSRRDSGDFAMARFRMGYLIALIFYNYSEATFKALHLSFFLFFLIAIDYVAPADSAAAIAPSLPQPEGPPVFAPANLRAPAPAAARISGRIAEQKAIGRVTGRPFQPFDVR